MPDSEEPELRVDVGNGDELYSVTQLEYGAFDGWRVTTERRETVEAIGQKPETMLFLELHLAGKCLHTVVVAVVATGTIELARTLILLDAVVGFMNSGGDLEAAESLLRAIKSGCEGYNIELPAGWKMIDWINESHNEFVLMNEAEGLIHRVIPEEFAETMPASDYLSDDDDTSDSE